MSDSTLLTSVACISCDRRADLRPPMVSSTWFVLLVCTALCHVARCNDREQDGPQFGNPVTVVKIASKSDAAAEPKRKGIVGTPVSAPSCALTCGIPPRWSMHFAVAPCSCSGCDNEIREITRSPALNPSEFMKRCHTACEKDVRCRVVMYNPEVSAAGACFLYDHAQVPLSH